MEFEKLTVLHRAENPEDDRRITISPMQVCMIAASEEDIVVAGRSLRVVTVMFNEGANVDIQVNHSDLELLERAIGSFCVG